MAITTETVLQRVKLGVNDAGGKWLTDAQYNTFCFTPSAIVQDDASHTFTLRSSGVWSLSGGEWGGNPYVLQFTDSTSPFTPTISSGAYSLSCWGSLTGPTNDTTASYTVTGAVIDYAALMSELYFWLANHRALQIANANGQLVGDTASYLRRTAQEWQGISAGGSLWSGK